MVTQINYPNSKFHFTNVSSNNLVDIDSSDGLVINDDNGLRTYINNDGVFLNNPYDPSHNLFVTYDTFTYTSGISGSKSLVLSPNDDNNKTNGMKLINSNNTTDYGLMYLKANHIYDISLNALTFKSTGSSTGQVVMADENGSPYWGNIPSENQSFSDVLTINANASGIGITNIPTIAFSASGSAVTVGTSGNTISLNCSTDSQNTRSFDSKYMPIVIGGTTYYLPLFV